MRQFVRSAVKKSFVRYVIVGGSAFVAEISSFYLLYYGAGVWLTVSNGLSFLIGLSTSFLLHHFWTFGRRHRHQTHKQLTMYVTVSSFNLLLTLVVVAWLQKMGLKPGLGKPAAMVFTSLWNFVIFRRLIFTQLEEPLEL